MTKVVVFRTDASFEIGSGHVMRCLTLANSLRLLGADCRFVCREWPGHLCDRIEASGFAVVRLPPPPDRMRIAGWLGVSQEHDADETRVAVLQQDDVPDWVIVDHYGIGMPWEQRIRVTKAIMVIDDLADRDHACEVLLDQNLVADHACRYESLIPAKCLRLLGPHYALLQEAYAKSASRRPAVDSAQRRVVVYFGGTDRRRLTLATVRALLALPSEAFAGADIVIDRHADQYNDVVRLLAGQSNFTIHTQQPSLAPLLEKAGIAIGAPGASSWERLYFGIPSIIIPLAANQLPIAHELERQGYAIMIDEAALSQANFTSLIGRAFAARDGGALALAKGLVDGRGSERCAASLCADPDMQLSLRPANADDEAILLAWSNDPETRRNAFTSEAIRPEIHAEWFARKLAAAADCRIFILETGHALPIGMIRFDRLGLGWNIGYSLAAHMRGQRLGARLIALGSAALREYIGPCSVIGRVKPDNLPSRRAFLHCGFSEMAGENVSYVEYRAD